MSTQTTPAPGWYQNPNGPGERFWDGSGWGEERGEATHAERTEALDRAIREWITKWGYRVESRDDNQAVISHGKRPNHLLHLILTILTVGLWGIVWIIISIGGGVKQRVLTVDRFAQVQVTKEQRAH